MKVTKKTYTLSSRKNRSYYEISSIKNRGDKKCHKDKALKYKSISYHKKKLNIKNVIIGAMYISTPRNTISSDYWAGWITTFSRRKRFIKQYKNLHNKMKDNK